MSTDLEQARKEAEQEWFKEFYAAYPRHVARYHAEKMWARLKVNAVMHEQILDGLERQLLAWQRDGTQAQYIPHPGTWLHGRRWEDEIEALAQRSEKPPERIEYEGNVLVWDGGWRREKGA
jgi:hypothetical protein